MNKEKKRYEERKKRKNQTKDIEFVMREQKMDRQTLGQMKDRWTNGKADIFTETQIVDGQRNGWTDRQSDLQMDRWADTNRHIRR